MGANAQTTVPSFTIGQVLTADQQNQSARTGVPVFATTVERDAAFGGAGEKTLAEGQLCYLEDTNKVQYYDGAAWANLGSVTNVEAFTASGTFTPPAGVTYAIAHIRAGGGAVGSTATAGGTSSVAFAGGTISATGGNPGSWIAITQGTAGQANSGAGSQGINSGGDPAIGTDGAYITAGGAVTPSVGITVTVGAGGTGTRAGGSGYVWIEYQV
jgi:hypothetical protein